MTRTSITTTTLLVTLARTILLLTATQPAEGLTPQQSWAAHKRALLQSELAAAAAGGRGNGTATPAVTSPPATRPSTPSPPPLLSPADALLDRLLSLLDRSDPLPALARRLLPEYLRAMRSIRDFAELKDRYAARLGRADHELWRMDQLGALLARLQSLASTASSYPPPPPHHHHHHHHERRRRRPGQPDKRLGWWQGLHRGEQQYPTREA